MPDFSDLITTIYQYGSYRPEGQQAIASLIEGGEPALAAYLTMRKEPPPSDVPSRDLFETNLEIIGRFSKEIPEVVVSRFEAGDLDELETYWALGMGSGSCTIDVLLSGLKSKDKFCRCFAADSLIQRRSKRAIPALIEALRDRSSDVKFSVVQAMQKRKDLRRPEALPGLRRIVASQSIRQHSPGLYKTAEDVIQLIERETKQPKA